MKTKQLLDAIVLVCGLLLIQSVQANLLTFDELPIQPVDGLNFNGVTFDFKVDGFNSEDARYNSEGPENTTYIQDPSLEGDAAGILTLDFDMPVDQIAFGVALSYDEEEPLSPGFTVELFDTSLVSMGITPVITMPLGSIFSEGQFIYSGPLVKQVRVDFSENAAPRFAFDNLSFNPVPEPATLLLVGLGGLVLRKRK